MTRGCTLGPRGISRPARPVLGSRRPTDHRGSPPALRCPHGPCSRRPSRSCFHLLSPPFRSIILSRVFLLDPGEHHELTRKQRDRSAPSHDRVQAAHVPRHVRSLALRNQRPAAPRHATTACGWPKPSLGPSGKASNARPTYKHLLRKISRDSSNSE